MTGAGAEVGVASGLARSDDAAPDLLRQPDFARLWAAQTISVFGSQISQLAIPLLAIVLLAATPLEVGLLTAAGFLPFLLIGLPAGAWVDRLRRRPLLIIADVGRAALLATIPLAHLAGGLTLEQLYLVTFTAGMLTVFFDVSYQAYLPSLVPQGRLMQGNSRLEVSRSGAEVAGPGLAGVLVQSITAPLAIAVDAASFLVSGLLIVSIRSREAAPSAARRETSLRAEIREGLSFVAAHAILRRITISGALANVSSSIVGAVLLIHAVRGLGLQPGVIGIVLALGTSGALAGALLAGRVQSAIGIGHTMAVGALLFGIGYLMLPVSTLGLPVLVLTAGIFVATLGAMLFSVTGMTLRQHAAPSRILGRVTATMRFVTWGTMPLGFVLGGALGSVIGLVPTIVVGASGAFLAALTLILSPIRRLRTFDSAGVT